MGNEEQRLTKDTNEHISNNFWKFLQGTLGKQLKGESVPLTNRKRMGNEEQRLTKDAKAVSLNEHTQKLLDKFLHGKQLKGESVPLKRKGRRISRDERIKAWTTSEGYIPIQSIRRNDFNFMMAHVEREKQWQESDSENKIRIMNDLLKRAKRTNAAVSQYMRNTHIRKPIMPSGMRTKYLYRGFHGQQVVSSLLKTKRLADPGFMSFSRSADISIFFAKKDPKHNIVLRIRVEDIPDGTPWLWFSKDKEPRYRGINRMRQSSFGVEEEVLLPPGRIILGKRIPTNNASVNMYEAMYIPNTKARSINKKPIIRRLGTPKRDSQIRETAYNKHLSAMFNRVMNLK